MPSPTAHPGGLTPADYFVIGAYLALMLAMGVRIALRQKSTNDFFLGGRNLPSWAVGISLIASLLSTITYLGMPGEMFRSGIGFLTRQLGLPLVLVVVWFLWIPFFMRLNLTSAYEYLERRFNYATRAVAAIFCLLLLFGWMSVVVLTASKAMAEITRLDLDWFFGRNIPATRTLADGSARIGPEDIRHDGSGLAARIRPPGETSEPTPGLRVWEFLGDANTRRGTASQAVLRQPEDARPLDDAGIRKLADALTAVIQHRDFYEAAYWETIRLNETAQIYLRAGVPALNDREVSHLNRALLESAFPREIAASRPEYRDADMHAIILGIGLFSVLYTTLGGIRAVVWTDVIQFTVLLGGAFFTMGAVAWMTGSGLGDWLAVSQAYKHEEVEWFSWDIRNRSTVFSIAIGMFFWTVCTHGSNQVALQRYFTVKDIRAARQSFLVGAVCSVALGVILAGVGIALMYFIRHHDMPAVADLSSAVASIRIEAQDKMFPQFIHFYIPSGLRGLVVAALFAAAMSTIDSGANSVSTIATVDFFRRLSPRAASRAGELKLARTLTATMGLVVVACTIFLYHISKGTDLITLCQKGFNCFLGPLGALFVLAMFCPWITGRSVIPAVVVGEAVGIGTSYSEELFGVHFSTHLVVPASWLATIVAAHVFALLLWTRATDEQRRWMWLPVVRGSSDENST